MNHPFLYALAGLIWCCQINTANSDDIKSQQCNFNGIFQYSTINALLDGYMEGDMSLQRLSRKGDFGLGTVNSLDGEMIAVDGTFYQIKSDGKAYELPSDAKTPFAVITRFEPEQTLKLPLSISYGALKTFLSENIAQSNQIQAIRIDGYFKNLKVRSIPKQVPPYRKLAQINKTDATTYEYKNVEGTLVGFRFPGYFNSLNVTGYHFHFIDKERTFGGHVLELTTDRGNIAIKSSHRFKMVLPEDEQFDRMNLSKDNSNDLKSVEKGQP